MVAQARYCHWFRIFQQEFSDFLSVIKSFISWIGVFSSIYILLTFFTHICCFFSSISQFSPWSLLSRARVLAVECCFQLFVGLAVSPPGGIAFSQPRCSLTIFLHPTLCLCYLPLVTPLANYYSPFLYSHRPLLCSWSSFLLPLTASPILPTLPDDHVPSVNETTLLMLPTINSASCFATTSQRRLFSGYLIVPRSFSAVLLQDNYFLFFYILFFIKCNT